MPTPSFPARSHARRHGRGPAERCLQANAHRLAGLLLAAGLTLLAGCASKPPSPSPPPSASRDGPPLDPPADLERVPDAEPRIEALRNGGPNKPYEIAGRRYEPEPRDVPMKQRGLASWYGRQFHGRPTALGERYDMYAMTAAHATMPLPSYARVRNPANGREVIVRINDRGPFHPGRIIDLSYAAALKLRLLRGVGIVEVERLTHDDIRSGAWNRERDSELASTAPAASPAVPVALPPPPAPPATVEGDAGEATPEPGRTVVATTGFWVQLGMFREADGAASFQRQVAAELDWIAPLLAVFKDGGGHRLQAGPYASREEARGAAARLREALKLVPVVVERR